MTKRVLDYMDHLTQRERKQRWTSTPVQKPAPKPRGPQIPEDDSDLMTYREELLQDGGAPTEE